MNESNYCLWNCCYYLSPTCYLSRLTVPVPSLWLANSTLIPQSLIWIFSFQFIDMELIHMDCLRSWGFLGQDLCLILETFCPTERCVLFDVPFSLLMVANPSWLHSKSSPPQEADESFRTSQKWHRRPHPHMPSLPKASIVSCQEPQVCLLRQLNSLAESAQDLKFHLVSFVKRIFSLPDAIPSKAQFY